MPKGSPYPWIREEDDQGNFSYTFVTDSNIVYSAYFDVADHEKFMSEFPTLLQNGYEFGFFRKPNTSKDWDYRVTQTIHNIVLDFLDRQPADIIVLYFCQPSDDNTEQRQREMLFQRTYNASPRRGEIVKRTLEIAVPVDDRIDNHFVGFFTNANNPDLSRAKQELDNFALKLSNEHIEK